jgi:hypothetical protein
MPLNLCGASVEQVAKDVNSLAPHMMSGVADKGDHIFSLVRKLLDE